MTLSRRHVLQATLASLVGGEATQISREELERLAELIAESKKEGQP